jgi:hypothetical protein
MLVAISSPPAAKAASAHIRVADRHGARIVGARAFLVGADHKLVRGASANSVGEIVLTGLPLGKSRLIIYSPGFKNRPLTISLRPDKEPWVEVVLEVEKNTPTCAENAVCL